MKKDKHEKMIDNFLSVPEAVQMGLPSSSIYHAINTKKIRVFQRGKIKLILKKDALKILGSK